MSNILKRWIHFKIQGGFWLICNFWFIYFWFTLVSLGHHSVMLFFSMLNGKVYVLSIIHHYHHRLTVILLCLSNLIGKSWNTHSNGHGTCSRRITLMPFSRGTQDLAVATSNFQQNWAQTYFWAIFPQVKIQWLSTVILFLAPTQIVSSSL